MPRRVNLTILLGLVVVIVLSFGLSATARPDHRAQKESTQDATAGGELDRLQKDAETANGAYKNALFEEDQLNNQIVQTRQQLADTEQQLKDAQDKLGNQAKELYKHGDLTLMDALTKAGNTKQFTDVFGLLTQQLGRDQAETKKLRESRDALQQTEKGLQSQVDNRQGILDKEAAKKEEAQQAMNDAQSAFDSLDPKDLENIKQERAQSALDAVEKMRNAPAQDSADGGSDQTGVADQTPEDQARKDMVSQAIEETINEWAAHKDPSQAKPEDGTAGNGGNPPQNHAAELAADAAQKQADANQQAKDAADQVTAEQQAQKKAADQAQAAENAKLAAQQNPGDPAAQSTAQEAQNQADLAAKDAAAQKTTAQQAADQAAAQKDAANKAAMRLTTDGQSLNPNTGVTNGQYNLNNGAAGSQPVTSGSGGGVIGQADTWLGVPYRAGGNSRSGIDCSAFTAAVYSKFGITLPDSPAGQWAMGTPVVGPPKAGDLVFFSEDGSGTPTHVGIADGNGNVIHASDYYMDVAVTPMKYLTGYMGAKRLL